MLYFVSGELNDYRILNVPHADFVERLRNVIMPSLKELVQLEADGIVLAGGIPASQQRVVLILKFEKAVSHLDVRRLLYRLPIFSLYRWDVTPLETFEEWLSLVPS